MNLLSVIVVRFLKTNRTSRAMLPAQPVVDDTHTTIESSVAKPIALHRYQRRDLRGRSSMGRFLFLILLISSLVLITSSPSKDNLCSLTLTDANGYKSRLTAPCDSPYLLKE